MKGIITTTLLATLFPALALASHCKVGDLKDCGTVLSKLNQTDKGPAFSRLYDEICAENKKFKCVKKIVRGEMTEEMKYTRSDYPKAQLFEVKIDNESYIYILEGK